MIRRPSGLRSAVLVALAVLVGLGVGVGAFAVARATAAGCSPLASDPCVRVLFLGNSYTYVNDLPAVFRDLARSGGRNVETGMVAHGGETLAEHAASADSLGAIRGSAWQVVVLQEQSQVPALDSARRAGMVPAVGTLRAAIQSAGATPLLFETWAHRDGWPEQRMDERGMARALAAGYRAVADQYGMGLAPAGEAWQAVLDHGPPVDLWQPDGSHPTMAGTYLAACVLYERIFNASPVGLGATEGLAPDVTRALQTAAAATGAAP